MSVIRVTKNDVESFTIVTTPSRSYVSSSTGVTGSVKVFPRKSDIEKETSWTSSFSEMSAAVDTDFEESYKSINKISLTNRTLGISISGSVSEYFDLVKKTPTKKTHVLDVERFTPTTKFTKYTMIKSNIKDVLMPYYRVDYPLSDWAYSNYNAVNFFSAYEGGSAKLPDNSVLLYPNVIDDTLPQHTGYVSGSYCLSGAFSFDFYINPRYGKEGLNGSDYKDGTIVHLSSSYSLSMSTGSLKDVNGYPEGFRLKLQLSHSADYSPSQSSPGSYPYNLVFLSDDNALKKNTWHHVVVRWGTDVINSGTGSFVVDGVDRGSFVIPSGTIMPRSFTASQNPDVLCVGNYYQGSNSGNSAQRLFFGELPAQRYGIYQLSLDDTRDVPDSFSFSHPLKAEIHDLVIRRHFISDEELRLSGSFGIGNDALTNNIAFYLPPFFVEETPIRRHVNGQGGVLQTPFFAIDGTTDDPFNVAMSFGVNGHYINLENFTKDFSTGRFPRLLSLSGSTIDYTTTAQEANTFLYADSQVAKRNLTILPCDDGNFTPNFEILNNEVYRNKFTDSFGLQDLSFVNLDNLVSTSSLLGGGVNIDAPEEYVETLYGPSPESPGIQPGSAYTNYINALSASISSLTQDSEFDRGLQKDVPLTIYQRTLDPSSNQVTIFNISNLYYGRRIQPGSFQITDSSLSGSYGSISITLKDDSMGNLYRADSLTPHATQNSVGNIFYDEGIVVIKSPHLYFFGKHQYEVSFRGIFNVYTQKYEILAPSGLLNSSSNPTYLKNYENLKASSDPNDSDPFVYISGLNFHDENMNVVAKARLAQPIIKREGDKILFKVTFDY